MRDTNTLDWGPGLTIEQLARFWQDREDDIAGSVLIPIPGSTTGGMMWLRRRDAAAMGLVGNAHVRIDVAGPLAGAEEA